MKNQAMQLILDAENSKINIREKMTTVEDSISKLTNGVEIDKAPEKVIESKPEKENSLNGDTVIESEKNIESVDKTVLLNITAAPCEDKDVSKNSDTISNGDNNIILHVSESTSKSESNGESRVDIGETEINLNNDKVETPEEIPEEDHHKEISEDKALDVPENPSKQQNNVKKLESEDPVENLNQESKENVNSDDSKEVIENKLETEDSIDNLSNTNDIIKPDDEEKLETQVPEDKLNQTSNENEDMEGNIAEKNAELSEMGEKENNEEQEKEKADSVELEPNVDNHSIVNRGDEEVQVSGTDDCSNVVSEPNLDDEKTDIVSIMTSTETSDNTASHIPTPVNPVDTEASAKSLENESSNAKEADMDCDVTPSSVEMPKESTPIPMDCDNLDLIENEKNKSVIDHEVINDTATHEETQVDQTNSLAVDAISEESVKENDESLMDLDAINETDDAQVEKTDSLAIEAVHEEVEKIKESIVNETTETKEDIPVISVPTVVQEVETIEEAVIKVNEATENAIEGKETSRIEEIKENVVQENSVPLTASSPSKDVNSDIEEVKVIDIDMEEKSTKSPSKPNIEKPTPTVCKLSNTLNILSDDEDEPPQKEIPESITEPNDKQCINIEDDDDVMVIEDTVTQDKPDQDESVSSECIRDKKGDVKSDSDSRDTKTCEVITEPEPKCNDEKESFESKIESVDSPTPQITEKETQEPVEEKTKERPLLPKDIFKSYRKKLSEMTRDELEEFCLVKIVESIIERSNLNEIYTRVKTMFQTMEETKKKTMMVTKQNRDLQVVLKSVQEEQKKGGNTPIVPLKITRSVGMQVLMTDKNARRKVNPTPAPGPLNANNRGARVNQSPRQQAPMITNQQIPVPRLVPATNTAAKPNPVQVSAPRSNAKPNSALSNGVKSSPPVPKAAEKRTRVQSVTVDLTDDEPPPKIPANKTSPAPPVRLVPSQNLLTPRAQMASNTLNNPRKVFIPIGSNQNQNLRPALMLKNVPNTGPRARGAAPMGPRGQSPNQIRMTRVNTGRHPAPLPDAVKQYQPPNWKALPPAPDLKLSKVENGIVISWKIDGYQEDSYEEIASYQLYAYQETSSPPQTSLWKKIGDVKALPLPMACTLTQFMAGYKYYFAVRAVDVRSRLGPFSLPGSILLLNKM